MQVYLTNNMTALSLLELCYEMSILMNEEEQRQNGESQATFFRRIGSKLTRRSLLGNSAKAGAGTLALSAAGPAAASSHEDEESDGGDGGSDGGGETEGISDLEILNFALTLEKLEYEFYREGLETFDESDISESEACKQAEGSDSAASIRDRLTDIRDHEKIHVDVITAVISAVGGEPVSDLEFEFPYETFDEFIGLAATFEPLGVDAYAGAAPFIDTTLLVPTALGIHSVEANHAAYLRDLNGENPVPQAFNNPMSMDSVVALASQFIVGANEDRQRFAVTIENVSSTETLETSDGSQAVPLSPGAYAVHSDANPIFTPGEAASRGLQRLAEDGFPHVLVPDQEHSLLAEINSEENVAESGIFLSLQGGLPPLDPGESTTFYVTAAEGESLSFASMFVPSNDAFFAPGEDGISLFGDGSPVSGDVTDQLTLWDAGTEENQEPGVGPDTKPNQSPTAIDVGSDEDESVRPVADVDDQYEFPSVSDVISVTVEPQ